MRPVTILVLTISLFAWSPALSGATSLLITSGVFSEGISGYKYTLSGDQFFTRGTDTVNFSTILNGISQSGDLNFPHATPGPILSQTATDTVRLYTFDASFLTGGPGAPPQIFTLVGSGIGDVRITPQAPEPFLTLTFADPRGTSAVPEPGTWLLLATGLLGLGWYSRRQRSTEKQCSSAGDRYRRT